MSSIDSQIRARHEATPIRKQKDSGRLEIIRYAELAQQCTPHPGLFKTRIRRKQLIGHRSSDILMDDQQRRFKSRYSILTPGLNVLTLIPY
jgi:hypothetical protein